MGCGRETHGNGSKYQEEEDEMPLIQVKLIEEVFTPAQKKEMITKLTDAMVSRPGKRTSGAKAITSEF